MLEETIEYARIVKPLGSSRFQLERLNGQTVEASLKGEMKNKSKNNKIEKQDWVRIQDLGMAVSGSTYKIVERIGSDKDKTVKDLKKNGLLRHNAPVIESSNLNSDMFDNEVKESKDDEIDENAIDDL